MSETLSSLSWGRFVKSEVEQNLSVRLAQPKLADFEVLHVSWWEPILAWQQQLDFFATTTTIVGVLVAAAGVWVTRSSLLTQIKQFNETNKKADENRKLAEEERQKDAGAEFLRTQVQMATASNEHNGNSGIPGPRVGHLDPNSGVCAEKKKEYRALLEAYNALIQHDAVAFANLRASIYNQTNLANYYHANEHLLDKQQGLKAKVWFQDGVIRWARHFPKCDDVLDDIARGDALTFTSGFLEDWFKPAISKYPGFSKT